LCPIKDAYDNAPTPVKIIAVVATAIVIAPIAAVALESLIVAAIISPAIAIAIVEIANDVFNESSPPITLIGGIINDLIKIGE
jgi:hypothetical protein